jgi:hypothetical protein
MTPLGIEPMTWFVRQCLNQLPHCVPPSQEGYRPYYGQMVAQLHMNKECMCILHSCFHYFDMIYLLTAVGLTPGGSNILYI